tara:strand:- start:204 stop:845 length:642 start_codon:yes stop_codon:yes gene_type:complete
MKTNFRAAIKWVNRKMNESWKYESGQSPCGFGSFTSTTTDSINFINNILGDTEHNIKSVLDLGCGDWNWFKSVDLQGSEYQGWDAGEQFIESNNLLYKNNHVKFHHKDIVTCTYPRVDLIICRDVLFHMPVSMAGTVIDNIRKASRYFICTNFNNETCNIGNGRRGTNQEWGYYRINVNINPFNLEPYLIDTHKEKRCSRPRYPRSINLYKFV